jgi:flagellar protein FliS
MTWETVYLENRVLAADPIELVNILYEYAILRTQEARAYLAQGDIALRSKAIAKAIAILGELDGSLDHKKGREIATNLGRLYGYMRERLTAGNMQQADAPLAEVERLLKTLHEAWQAIQTDRGAAPAGSDFKDEGIPAGPSRLFAMETAADYSAHGWTA